MSHRVFKLSDDFVNDYKDRYVNWGDMGEFTYLRTYSRIKDDGTKEQWYETVRRVVEGTFSIQKNHCDSLKLVWNHIKAQKSAKIMYDKIFNFKFLPPGRGLWLMGSKFVIEKGSAALNNCGFISTDDIKTRGSFVFTWTMDALMLGVGIGFDTKGAGHITIQKPKKDGIFIIPDSREGWVESLGRLLDSFFQGRTLPSFDYSLIRPCGAPIKGFGGVASGPEPLKTLHESVYQLLSNRAGSKITSVDIVDIMNMIGICVVAGNVRRSAEIAIGDWRDTDYVTMKDYTKFPEELQSHRWASNNSIFAEVGKTKYENIAESIALNGEPGVIWLENIRAFSRMQSTPDYKDIMAAGTNPCAEQSLESGELCCVSGDTRIQTKTGAYRISSLVGKEVEVWNGNKWSKVKPFIAGKYKKLYRVTLSDGSYLDSTEDHKWKLKEKTKRIYKNVETKDIVVGSQSVDWGLPTIEGIQEDLAYEYGLFSGDGYIDGDTPMLCVCGEKIKLQKLNIKGRWWKPQILEGYSEPYNRLSFKEVLDLDKCIELNDKYKGLPDWVFTMNDECIREFIGGLIDTDGNVCRQANTDNVRIFGNEAKIRDLQLLLRRIGVNHASVYGAGAAGEQTNKGIRNYSIYCCYIPSYECNNLHSRVRVVTRVGSNYKNNNAYTDSKLIDSSRKQRVVSVELIGGLHTTYCFSEPENHMGVFGNVLTYQCLVESFPSLHDTLEEYIDTLKYAYMYAKSVTLLPTHWPETNAILLKNRRIGLSQSGIIDAFVRHGRYNMVHVWNKEAYDAIQRQDAIYSDWFCVPRSKKTTSVKPSGSVSLLAGVSPGIHYPHSEYYIRRIRVASESSLVQAMIDAGYYVCPEIYGDETERKKTSIIHFPIHEKNFTKKKGGVSIWEQVKNAVDYQKTWADNSVSITVTFNKDEAKDITAVLYAFESELKTISFLPIAEHGYQMAPYEEISKDVYDEMVANIKTKPDFTNFIGTPSGSKFCDGDSCEAGLSNNNVTNKVITNILKI
jgi:ribonucleotide reductase alpha subunit